MIRVRDAVTLAHTKLRTHRIRTGISVGIAGLLFGLILAVIIVAQGVFNSIERFGKEGLGDRMIMTVSKYDANSFNVFDHMEDAAFIAEVEQTHGDYVAKKTALAKKYGIDYDAKLEDPSPIVLDSVTKQKRIAEEQISNEHVYTVILRRTQEAYKPFDIEAYLRQYPSATIINDNASVQPSDGRLVYMPGGAERELQESVRGRMYYAGGDEDPMLTIASEKITTPFVMSSFDPTRGEIPIIVTVSQAEKLLGLKPLTKESSNVERLSRLQEVRERVSEVTASYCYRNQASLALLSQATAQSEEIARNKANADYVMPALQYTLPSEGSCGVVTIAKDTRTAAEKHQGQQMIAYQTELGTYPGEPIQHKVVVRGVGIVGDPPGIGSMGTVSDLVGGLLSSWLGWNTFIIPADLLRQVPEDARPEYLFALNETNAGMEYGQSFHTDTYFVEFTDKEEARDAVRRGGTFTGGLAEGEVSVAPYGSSALVVDEMKTWFRMILFWALAVVGGIALVILASIIGRTVAEGRRESAVFRAIGASRVDIGGIYGMYVLFLAVRVVLFALVLGGAVALTVQLLYGEEATVSARLAYAASDTTKEFYLMGFGSWYIALILGTIVIVSLLASIIPILLGARRNPIKDMRNE